MINITVCVYIHIKPGLCVYFCLICLEQENSQSDLFPPDNDQYVQERKFHQRAIFPTSSATHSRQQFIDLLRQAYSQGWKPNIKHYMPATRFGRHR